MDQATSTNTIKVNTQLTLDDFKKFSFYALYRNKSIVMMAVIGVFLILCGIYLLFYGIPFSTIYLSFIIGLFFSGFSPLMILISAKRNFSSSKELSSRITYEFDPQFISSSSEFAQTKTPWTNLFKVEITKEMLLLYRSRQIANVVPLRYFTQAQIAAIKQFVLSNKVKANFRK